MAKEPHYKHFTRGGQIAFHNLRMFFQINKALFNVHCVCWLIFFVGTVYFLIPLELLQQTSAYMGAYFFKLLRKEHLFVLSFSGDHYKQSVAQILHYPYYANTAAVCFQKLLHCVWVSFGASISLAVFIAAYFIKKGKFESQTQLIRGTKLVDSHVLKRQIRIEKQASDITIDRFPLIKDSEFQHMLVHGTVGTGKSQLMMKILDCLRARGDRVILYDKGCAFMPLYYQAKRDKVLNPFDMRCSKWDLWREAPRDSDLENMAESLIPIQGENDPFWVNAARTVFVSAASRMRHDKERSLDKLLRLLLTSEFSQLEAYLAGTPASTLVSQKIEKTAISIRSVITTYIKSLQSISSIESDTVFSVRDYLLNDEEQGWLFISSNGEHHKTLKPLMSMWLAMGSLTMLSLDSNVKRRIWFICDELPSLHKLPLLGETIAEVRKFGGCFLLGMQSFAQLEKVYGRSGAGEIFDLLNTRFFFRSPSSEMARIVSRELGEEDLDESRENYSYGANSVRDGISLGSQRVVRPVVTYPEIFNLPNLACFVRLPGHYPVTQLRLKHQRRPVIADALDLRNVIAMDEFNASNYSVQEDQSLMSENAMMTPMQNAIDTVELIERDVLC